MTVALLPSAIIIVQDGLHSARKSRRGTRPALPETSFKKMKPADRVRLAIEMGDVACQINLRSIRDRNPGILKANLIEEGRKRLHSGHRTARRIRAN